MTALQNRVDNLDVPFVEWDEFKRQFKWRQGEHVTLIGTTGSGKTETMIRILGLGDRKRIVVLATKGKDETMQQLLRAGYARIKSWAQMPSTDRGPVYPHVVLWPDIRGLEPEDLGLIRRTFLNAMSHIYREGGWCLAVDEISFISDRDMVALDGQLKFMLQQGRSSGISVIGGTQRPAWIPLAFYQSATHLFFWRENDSVNLKRIGDISGNVDKRAIMSIVQNLKGPSYETDPDRETLYVNTRTGKLLKTVVKL